jgi:ssDNA-binding replication factor A large subunit
MVAINGVVQTPGEAYVVAGNELIFIDSTSTAYPVENGAVIDVRHLSSPSVPATRVDTFTGDGSTQTFTLSVGAEDKYGVIVFVDNVYQDPEVYTVSGTTLTFPDGAPSNGDRINVLNYSSIPAPNVITRADAVDEAITYSIALG